MTQFLEPEEILAVELANRSVEGVRGDDAGAALGGTCRSLRQALLVAPREELVVVFDQPILVVADGIGRVQEDQVARLRFIDERLEIAMMQLGTEEQGGNASEIVCIFNYSLTSSIGTLNSPRLLTR